MLMLATRLLARLTDPMGYNKYYERHIRSQLNKNIPHSTYLLITTSSKIYSLRIPSNFEYDRIDSEQLRTENDVIYAESDLSNNWITDAFYVKSENLIYVNVYNSTASSSNIFTLEYNKDTHSYTKRILYKDQSYCLGISYNEEKKELYWTTSKSIIAGSSEPNGEYHVLFELNRAKKLLYLKYDKLIDVLYVSTLNYVYECSLGDRDFTQSILYTQRCRIIARNLVSARGLYLDEVNRYLYVVDHKKRNINRIKLKNVDGNIDQDKNTSESVSTYEDRTSLKKATTFLSQQTMPAMGDIFYMCIYNRSNADLLIWSEFSGKIKATRMDDTSEHKVLFSTNEYTYSISLMDNSTEESESFESEMNHGDLKDTSTLKTVTSILKSTTSSLKSVSNTESFDDYVYRNDIIKTDEMITTLMDKVINLETKSLNPKKDVSNEIIEERVENEKKIVKKESRVLSVSSRKFLVNKEDLLKNDLDTNLITAKSMKTGSKLSFIQSSKHLNAALYIVICLLCFSLIINIILLYISKIKHNKSKQIIISHEICDINGMTKRGGSATTKSTSESSSESNDCNLNLINSSGSATSGLDSDH